MSRSGPQSYVKGMDDTVAIQNSQVSDARSAKSVTLFTLIMVIDSAGVLNAKLSQNMTEPIAGSQCSHKLTCWLRTECET